MTVASAEKARYPSLAVSSFEGSSHGVGLVRAVLAPNQQARLYLPCTAAPTRQSPCRSRNLGTPCFSSTEPFVRACLSTSIFSVSIFWKIMRWLGLYRSSVPACLYVLTALLWKEFGLNCSGEASCTASTAGSANRRVEDSREQLE